MPAAGAVYRLLQLLHATAQAGWWQTEDGRTASFTDVAKTLLDGSGVNLDYIHQYLARAYDQQNWHDFIDDLDREAGAYYRRRLRGGRGAH